MDRRSFLQAISALSATAFLPSCEVSAAAPMADDVVYDYATFKPLEKYGQKYALLYELMEVAHLYFEDASAQHNGTPPDVRRFQFASKLDETNHRALAGYAQGAKQ